MKAVSRKRVDPRATWQRLSIRIKLLLPALIAVGIAFVVLLWRVPPPVNALVEGNIRGVFSTRLGELRTPLTHFLEDAQKDLLQLANSDELSSYLMLQGNGDKTEQSAAQSALASLFVSKITDEQLPYAQIRFVGTDGKQMARADGRLIGDAVSGVLIAPSELGSEDIASYATTVFNLPEGRSYALPVRLSNPDKSSGLLPEPLIELVIPVYYRSQPAGLIISSLRANTLFTDTFRQSNQSNSFRSLLVTEHGRIIVMTDPAQGGDVVLLGNPVASNAESVLPTKELENGTTGLQALQGQGYITISLGKQNSLPENNWLLIASENLDIIYAGARELALTLILTLTIVFIIVIGGIIVIGQSVIQPLILVSHVADQIAAGDLQAQVPQTSEDEVGMVARALNTMSARLSELIRTLEIRVQERTRNIEIAAEISRDTAQLSSLHELLQRTVNAIQQRFSLYHVQIFLADEENRYAILEVGSGDIANQLLAREHKLEIGSNSIVGQAMEKGQPFSTLDTADHSVPHRFNPLLPLTRSEIATPLRIGDKTIGVLDLQSIDANAFNSEDIEVFQMMADQIAIAVTNTRLFERSEEARRIADEANHQKSEFLSNMSHELRTPLNVIIGYSNSILHRPAMYEDIPLPKTYSSAVESIMVSGQHLLGLINDILDLSKIEAGRTELDIRPINVWPILEGIRSTTLGLLKSGVKLRADYPPMLPLVMADELRFRQIVLNLVSNAAKFTEQGFITLDVAVQDGFLLCSVADTGMGIPEEAKTLIFGRFRQASASITKKMGGTGLGLNISQQLTIMQGGKIWFESTLGKGTTFYFTMPLASPEAVELLPVPLSDSQLRRPAASTGVHIFADEDEQQAPMRQILLIDSNSETASLLELALIESKYSVLTTDNPDRALNIATMLLPDAVVIHLHDEDAGQMKTLAWRMHQDENLTNTTIIVLDPRQTQPLRDHAELCDFVLDVVQAKVPTSQLA